MGETAHSLERQSGISFLMAKTMPVDAYKIRNSLYLTQSMRTPPAAAVNVIMREDAGASSAAAKYKMMEGQIETLKQQFEDGLKSLRGMIEFLMRSEPELERL